VRYLHLHAQPFWQRRPLDPFAHYPLLRSTPQAKPPLVSFAPLRSSHAPLVQRAAPTSLASLPLQTVNPPTPQHDACLTPAPLPLPLVPRNTQLVRSRLVPRIVYRTQCVVEEPLMQEHSKKNTHTHTPIAPDHRTHAGQCVSSVPIPRQQRRPFTKPSLSLCPASAPLTLATVAGTLPFSALTLVRLL
jgi:hypothetical protein